MRLIDARVAIPALITASFASTGLAQLSGTHHVRTDATGSYIETSHRSAKPSHPFAPRGSGLVWEFNDPASITNSVSIGDNTNDTWIAHNLNNHRLALHQTLGDGTPVWDFPLSVIAAGTIAVAAAEEAPYVAVLTGNQSPDGTPVSVRYFPSKSGEAPLWQYDFPAGYLVADYHGVSISADGSIVAAVGRDTTNNLSIVAFIDGETGAELLTMPFAGMIGAVELSADGSRAVLTRNANADVVSTADGTTLHTFSVVGTGGYHRISRDGTTAAAGGFNYVVWKEVEGVWVQLLNRQEPTSWFGYGIALDAAGETLFTCSHNYMNYLQITYIATELTEDMSELGRYTTTAGGTSQSTVAGGEASSNGSVFAAITWGSDDNAHPEAHIFDRNMNVIGTIDTFGSAFSLDVAADGTAVVVGTKHGHANAFGRGSDTYLYALSGTEPPACACDWNNDEALNSQDFFDFLTAFFANNADFNSDKVTNSQDFFDFLTCFFDGCQ